MKVPFNNKKNTSNSRKYEEFIFYESYINGVNIN